MKKIIAFITVSLFLSACSLGTKKEELDFNYERVISQSDINYEDINDEDIYKEVYINETSHDVDGVHGSVICILILRVQIILQGCHF